MFNAFSLEFEFFLSQHNQEKEDIGCLSIGRVYRNTGQLRRAHSGPPLARLFSSRRDSTLVSDRTAILSSFFTLVIAQYHKIYILFR